MSETIERLARAMAEKNRGDDFWPEMGELSDIDYLGKDHFRDMARTAIAALREPSQAMIAAACDDFDKRKGRQSYTDVWQAMIDGALK